MLLTAQFSFETWDCAFSSISTVHLLLCLLEHCPLPFAGQSFEIFRRSHEGPQIDPTFQQILPKLERALLQWNIQSSILLDLQFSEMGY